MESEKQIHVLKGIRPYDRCKDGPIWQQEKNLSTYYNHIVETQCVVMTGSIEQAMSEILAQKQSEA